MTRATIFSSLFHAIAIALAYIGLPSFFSADLAADRVVVVELVPVAAERNLPPDIPDKPEPRDEPQEIQADAEAEPAPQTREPRPKPTAALPAPPVVTDVPPAPAPESRPEPSEPAPAAVVRQVQRPVATQRPAAPIEAAASEPEPEPEIAPEPAAELVESVDRPSSKPPRPEPQADFEPEPEPEPKPEPKVDPFASVLKSVEALEQQQERERQQQETQKPTTAESSFDPIEQVLAQSNSRFQADLPLSMSEIDNIRYQIQKNWNVPAGARDAQDMIVTLRIQLAQDGTVRNVSVVNSTRMGSDPFFRSMAESAVRAVNVTGRIRNLSPDKYHIWRDMQINFDPREMFG